MRSTLIRMTVIGTHVASVLAAGAVAAGSVFAAGSDEPTTPTALVIDAALAQDGRDLVDSRLEHVDAAVRLPRDAGEARVNVRYFEALGYHVYVAGPDATAAAERTGADATPVDGLDGALKAAR
jgi:hypothetical protein